MIRLFLAIIGMIAVGWLVWRLLQQQETSSLAQSDEHEDAQD